MMIFGAGLVAACWSDRRRARLARAGADRQGRHLALPFEALYQAGLHALTPNQPASPGRSSSSARSAARTPAGRGSTSGRRCTSRWRWRSPRPASRGATCSRRGAPGRDRAGAGPSRPTTDHAVAYRARDAHTSPAVVARPAPLRTGFASAGSAPAAARVVRGQDRLARHHPRDPARDPRRDRLLRRRPHGDRRAARPESRSGASRRDG